MHVQFDYLYFCQTSAVDFPEKNDDSSYKQILF